MQMHIFLILCSGLLASFGDTLFALKSQWMYTNNELPYNQDLGSMFAKRVVDSVKASSTMTKLFDFHRYPRNDITNAFYTATRDVLEYIGILLIDIVANISREAVEKAFDPSLFLEIFSKSLGQYLLYGNYLNPDPIVVAESFIRHLKETAESIDISTSNALTIVKALVTSMNRFFIEDLLKIGPSLLSAFVRDLAFADYGTGDVSDVVLGNGFDKTNLTIFIKAAQKNISSDDTLLKVFNANLTATYVADRFYEVIYDAGVEVNLNNPENYAQMVKHAILVHYSSDNYRKAVLTAYGTFLLQHNYYLQMYPKIEVMFFTKYLRNNYKKAEHRSEVEVVLKTIHKLLSLWHISLESPPSFLQYFLGNLYVSKGINYTFPDLLQYEKDNGLYDFDWADIYATTDL